MSKREQASLSPDVAAKGDIFAQAYALMGYDAVAVGPYDLHAGLDFLVEIGRKGIPWISANLTNATGALIFEPYRQLQIGSIQVAVIGLTGAVAAHTEKYTISDDPQLLQPLIASLGPNNDLLILLSSMTYEQNVEIARLFPELSIIIVADPKRDAIPAQLHHQTLIVQPGNRGRYLGFLRAGWTGAPWGEAPEAERLRLQERMASLTHQLHRLSIQADQGSPARMQKIQHLEQTKAETEAALDRLNHDMQSREGEPLPSSYQSVFLPLDHSAPTDRRISDIVDPGVRKLSTRTP